MIAFAMNVEQWLPAVDHSGYEVSDEGRVRSLERVIVRRNGTLYPVSARILKSPREKLQGYRYVTLHGGNRSRKRRVHQLVMEAFVGPRPLDQQVRHLNGNPEDNRLCNLVYGTGSENQWDSIRHGTKRNQNTDKTHCPADHPYDLENTYIYPDGRRECRKCHQLRDHRRRAVA